LMEIASAEIFRPSPWRVRFVAAMMRDNSSLFILLQLEKRFLETGIGRSYRASGGDLTKKAWKFGQRLCTWRVWQSGHVRWLEVPRRAPAVREKITFLIKVSLSLE